MWKRQVSEIELRFVLAMLLNPAMASIFGRYVRIALDQRGCHDADREGQPKQVIR